MQIAPMITANSVADFAKPVESVEADTVMRDPMPSHQTGPPSAVSSDSRA